MAAKVGAEYRPMDEHRRRLQTEAELRRQSAGAIKERVRRERQQVAEERREARREAWNQYDRARRATLKVRARRALQDAVRRGTVRKPSACQACGNGVDSAALHGHHDDYRKPLDVRWLCVSCHALEHGGSFGDAPPRRGADL